ncbi:hypothetical protein ACHAXS_000203, partial [Conticribra weissflogii]
MSSVDKKCQWCQSHDFLKKCQQCRLVYYCNRECQVSDWKDGHNVICSKLPKAIKNALDKVHSFHLSNYTTQDVGSFLVTEAQAHRGEILEEKRAQELCYDAMEMKKGSAKKLNKILQALNCFPLSTEAWGMIGQFYLWEIHSPPTKECSEAAVKAFDTAILCARKLNPTWSEDRRKALTNDVEHRPYFRSLRGRAHALKWSGKIIDAIIQGKKLILLQQRGGAGMGIPLCGWYLESGNTEGVSNLLRKFGTYNTSFAYHDVLLQFLLWRRDDAVEFDVDKALYTALKHNPYVPDIVISDDSKQDSNDNGYCSVGSLSEAKTYVTDFGQLWMKHPELIEWLKEKKNEGGKVPTEFDLIRLLKSGVNFGMICTHSDLDG